MRTETERLIEAGAVVGGPVAGDTVDAITARSYRHPALDDRVVVTLVPQALGPAEDLALEFLGFQAAAEPVVVGAGARQALGFPAWAVINDPVHGHHALALVKDIERLARVAQSKPGLAKDGFDELGERLGQAVPHFLPTYFEQVGRAFMAADNRQAAAMMFGRAREAERVHALAIDEDRQRDVFLEFAFNGALTAKSLTQHSKDLSRRAEPAAAYELFLRICLERVAGGLPPYAGMAEDLRRLARAAKLPTAEQDERVVGALLDSPAIPHAPLAFWKVYTPTLIRLARADLAVRARLLDLLPVTPQDGMDDLWLDLLAETGADAGLIEVGDDPLIARPRDGAAGWMSRVVRWRGRGWHRSGRWSRLLELTERMAPRLRAEKTDLELFHARAAQADLDLIDLCVSLELAVAVPADLGMLPLWSWLADDTPGARDLTALARTDWARQPLLHGLSQAFSSLADDAWEPAGPRPALRAEQVEPLLTSTGLREILAIWLERITGDAERGALADLEAALDELAPAAIDVVLGVAPEAAARLSGVDVGSCLARTLRAGLLDELGWPALEEAVAEFPALPPGTFGHSPWRPDRFGVQDAWPALTLVSRARVTVVGPRGVLLRHDVRIPADHQRGYGQVTAVYVDGEVLVCWHTGTGRFGYWSSRPDEVFEVKSEHSYGDLAEGGQPLPGGGRTIGGRPVLRGDTSFSSTRPVAGDGEHWWRQDNDGWREYDARTGDAGRRSRPAFFEDALAQGDGAELLDRWCRLAPLPPGLEGSRFGTAGGLLGWRVVRLPDGARLGESVGGALVRMPADLVERLSAVPVGVLQWPGAGPAVTVLSGHGGLRLMSGDLVGSRLMPGAIDQPYARGTELVPPFDHWHALRSRDEAGSAVLRAVTDAQARALVVAAQDVSDPIELEAKVRAGLPGITHPKLIAGVAGVLKIAVGRARQVQDLPVAVSGPVRPAAEAAELPDALLSEALAGLTDQRHHFYSSPFERRAAALDSLRAAVTRARTAPAEGRSDRPGKSPDSKDFPVSQVEWTAIVGGLGAIALRAAGAVTPDEERLALLALLAAVQDTPLAEPDGRWRVVRATSHSNNAPAPGTVLRTSAGQAVLLGAETWWGEDGTSVQPALEHSPSGVFGVIPGYTVRASRPSAGWGGTERIAELIELVRARGPVPWRPDAVPALVEATGLTRAEAALLLAGLPGGRTWEHNFLSRHTREMIGLKVAEAAAAQPTLRQLSVDQRLWLCSLAMPEHPADLWDRGPDVEALAAGWVKLFGRRVAVPEDLVAELSALLPKDHGALAATEVLQGLADPAGSAWLSRDLKCTIDGAYLNFTGRPGFDGSALRAAVAGLAWMAYRLPLDDPFRARLGLALDALRQRLANPQLLVPALRGFGVSGLRAVYGHPQRSLPAGARPSPVVFELGAGGVLADDGWEDSLFLRPAGLSGPDDPLLKLSAGFYDPVTTALRTVVDPGFVRLIEGGAGADAGSGWAQDPLVSVPELVPDVAARLAVDADAARLYLQLLALPDPNDKNVNRWNGWTVKQLKPAAAALRAVGAVVDGKRSRAGRTVFLPCGWLDLKAPFPPIEVWKVPLLSLLPDGRGPLGLTVPTVPLPELFHQAWARVLGGDGPRLEQFDSGRRR